MRKVVGVLAMVLVAAWAAPAWAGTVLIDNFNDQDTTSQLLYQNGTSYGTWQTNVGTIAFGEVAGGNYALSLATASYADVALNGAGRGVAGFPTYDTNNRIEALPTDAANIVLRLINLGASATAARSLTVGGYWQDSTAPSLMSGSRRASVVVDLPSIAAGGSCLVEIPLASFVDTRYTDAVLGSENDVMFGGLLLTDCGFGTTSSVYLDDVAFTAVPEPATMGLLGLGLVSLTVRRGRRK